MFLIGDGQTPLEKVISINNDIVFVTTIILNLLPFFLSSVTLQIHLYSHEKRYKKGVQMYVNEMKKDC